MTVNKLLFTQIIMSHSNRYKALIFSTWREVIMPVWPCSTAIGWVDFKDHTRITCKRGQANELQCITNNNRRTQNYIVMNCPLKPGFHMLPISGIRYFVLFPTCNHARFLPWSAIYCSLHNLKTQICTARDVTNPWTIIAFAWFLTAHNCLVKPVNKTQLIYLSAW